MSTDHIGGPVRPVRGTPVDRAVNIGPVLSDRLRSVGIGTLEQLKQQGFTHVRQWEVRNNPDTILQAGKFPDVIIF